MMKRDGPTATLLIAVAACAIAAVGTAVWILRFGLFAPRASLSGFHVAARLVLVVIAGGLLFVRRDTVERVALSLSVIAAASSGLCGLGIETPTILAVRLIAHLAAYSMWAVAGGRMLRGGAEAGR